LFSTISRIYLEQHELSYQKANDIIGALEGAKLEFYRRVVSGYENRKISSHGDMYGELATDDLGVE